MAISLTSSESDDEQNPELITTAHNYYVCLHQLKQEIHKNVFGQDYAIENSIISILAGGHALLIGMPGLAKTKLVETLGKTLGLEQKRIQFTPDLMPSDIIGSEILEEGENGKFFRYIKGPIFTQILMADEINRASPRTQSALLQAMQEYQVTVNGIAYAIGRPFHVLATQNPLEQEGTYPLPEAQLDRFLMQILIDYPDFDTEKNIITQTTTAHTKEAQTVFSPKKLLEIQDFIRKMPLSENVVNKILVLTRSARPNKENSLAQKYVLCGPGPRATQALALCIRARALLHNRLAPAFEDIRALAKPILRHRIVLNFTARSEMLTIDDFIDLLLEETFSCP